MIGSVQSRMARCALKWGIRSTAEKAGVAASTLQRLEADENIHVNNLSKIINAYKTAGVTFLEDDGNGPGVRVRQKD